MATHNYKDTTDVLGNEDDQINLDICVHLANKGDVRAMYKLALHYLRNHHTISDKQKGIDLMIRASESGFDQATSYLSNMMDGESIDSESKPTYINESELVPSIKEIVNEEENLRDSPDKKIELTNRTYMFAVHRILSAKEYFWLSLGLIAVVIIGISMSMSVTELYAPRLFALLVIPASMLIVALGLYPSLPKFVIEFRDGIVTILSKKGKVLHQVRVEKIVGLHSCGLVLDIETFNISHRYRYGRNIRHEVERCVLEYSPHTNVQYMYKVTNDTSSEEFIEVLKINAIGNIDASYVAKVIRPLVKPGMDIGAIIRCRTSNILYYLLVTSFVITMGLFVRGVAIFLLFFYFLIPRLVDRIVVFTDRAIFIMSTNRSLSTIVVPIQDLLRVEYVKGKLKIQSSEHKYSFVTKSTEKHEYLFVQKSIDHLLEDE